MFSNIGGKIKMLAKILCWIGIVLSVIAGALIILTNSEAVKLYEEVVPPLAGGIFVIVVGVLGSWIGSFVLYGFGELVDNSSKQKKLLEKIANR